jgi:protein TonB
MPIPPPPVTPPPELATPEPPPPEPIPEPPKPQFIVPEERPIATPRPHVAAATPREHPHHTTITPSTTATSAGDGAPTGKAGTRGSPGGQAGSHGGSRGDFISTPQPQYDEVARQRGYQGRTVVIIHYTGGAIVAVSVEQSSGIPYLDARTTSWISSRWRVKPGASGNIPQTVTWQLR